MLLKLPESSLLPCPQQRHGRLVRRLLPSIPDLLAALQSCRERHDAGLASKMHERMLGLGLGGNDRIGVHLVLTFLECGASLHAQQTFLRLPRRDERAWTSLISAFVDRGKLSQAFDAYETMRDASVSPTCHTLMPLVKAYADARDAGRGRYVHMEIVRYGYDTDVFTGSGLIDMYAKCGLLHEATYVFDTMRIRTVVSWTALIAGYAAHGPAEGAFERYEQMKQQLVPLDASTLVCVLKACASVGSLSDGREAHADSVLRGLDSNDFLSNSLVDMYAKCGSLADAQGTSDSLSSRNVVSWTALIGGYAEHGPAVEALHCFDKMKLEGVNPDAVTFASVLKACGSSGELERGREIHLEIPPRYLDKYFFLANAVVDMYLKCGSFVQARDAFDKLQQRDLAPWHALIAGYAERGNSEQVMECIDCMQLEGVFLDSGAYVSMLKACGNTESKQKNQELHAEITKKGFESDSSVGNSLVDMYSKQGAVQEAQEVFDKLSVRDVVSWTALIAGYVEGSHPQEAIALFEHMYLEGVSPNDVTLVCILKSCVDMGAISKGYEVHVDIMRKGFEEDASVCNSLIDMYARCGSLPDALRIFCKIQHRDIVSWNSMIKGYGMNDEVELALQCFDEMHKHGVRPDNITFTCLLHACSRAKLQHKGQEIFKMMIEKYGISPTIDHYTCMVDLYAKSGCLVEIEDFLNPASEPSLWTALLTACKMHGERDLGNRCFEQLVRANPDQAAPYILMAKTYLNDGFIDDISYA